MIFVHWCIMISVPVFRHTSWGGLHRGSSGTEFTEPARRGWLLVRPVKRLTLLDRCILVRYVIFPRSVRRRRAIFDHNLHMYVCTSSLGCMYVSHAQILQVKESDWAVAGHTSNLSISPLSQGSGLDHLEDPDWAVAWLYSGIIPAWIRKPHSRLIAFWEVGVPMNFFYLPREVTFRWPLEA